MYLHQRFQAGQGGLWCFFYRIARRNPHWTRGANASKWSLLMRMGHWTQATSASKELPANSRAWLVADEVTFGQMSSSCIHSLPIPNRANEHICPLGFSLSKTSGLHPSRPVKGFLRVESDVARDSSAPPPGFLFNLGPFNPFLCSRRRHFAREG